MSTLTLVDGAPVFEVVRTTLPSGLDVVVHHDPMATLTAVNVVYRVGSSDEPAGTSGRAHLFEHLFKNSEHLAGQPHYEILRRAGATGNASTGSDRTSYYEVVPPEQLDLALWLESDRMGYFVPGFSSKRLAQQQAVVKTERRDRYENTPYGAERFAIAASLYDEDHPGRHLTIGTPEHIDAATTHDIEAFYRTWSVPANATLVIAGPDAPDAVMARVQHWFGSFPASQRPARPAIANRAAMVAAPIEVHDRFASLPRMHWVWRGPSVANDADETSLDLLANAMVKTGSGRLWRRLVYDAQLAQRIGAWMSSNRLDGEFHIAIDLRPGTSPLEIAAIIDDEMQRIYAGDIDAADFARIASRRRAVTLWSLEQPLNRAQILQRGMLYYDDPQALQREFASMNAVTPASATAAAQRWLARPAAVRVDTTPL